MPGAESDAPISRLTSVVLRKSGRSYAVIDGAVVHVGDTVGDARLQQIRENSVVLKPAAGPLETLMLTPGIEKKIKPAPAGKSPASPASGRPTKASLRAPS